MKAIQRHTANLKQKWIDLQPHSYAYLREYTRKQAELKPPASSEVTAFNMLCRLPHSIYGYTHAPTSEDLIWAFEALYERDPRRAVKVLRILLAYPSQKGE